jgi:hypothetical protein
MNTRHLRKLTPALLIAAIAACWWIPRQIGLANARRDLSAVRIQLADLRDRAATGSNTLESLRDELRAASERRSRAASEAAKATRAAAAVNPDARWVAPPKSLPEWNPESPYVWLKKESVGRFPVPVFTEDGELRAEVGIVFVIDPASQRALNKQLKELLAEYRALEAAKAERSDEHLPGIATQKGEKLTIRVKPLPEDGARIKQQFEAALVNALGQQRAGLLTQVGDTWIRSQFAQFGAEPKIISVARNSEDNFSVSVKSGRSWFSTGGPARFMRDNIPPHLRPLFGDWFDRGNPAKENP